MSLLKIIRENVFILKCSDALKTALSRMWTASQERLEKHKTRKASFKKTFEHFLMIFFLLYVRFVFGKIVNNDYNAI